MASTDQQPLLENPEVAETAVEKTEEQVTAQVSPAAPDYENYVGDRDKVDVKEVRISLDTVVTDPSAPEAVVVPPEGRGDLTLPIDSLDAPSAEQLLASGDAPEAKGQVDGVTVTADEAEKAKAEAKS